jgi:hypothetical protein
VPPIGVVDVVSSPFRSRSGGHDKHQGETTQGHSSRSSMALRARWPPSSARMANSSGPLDAGRRREQVTRGVRPNAENDSSSGPSRNTSSGRLSLRRAPRSVFVDLDRGVRGEVDAPARGGAELVTTTPNEAGSAPP